MLDPDVRKLLDTVFAAPAPAGPPDVRALRAAAEAAPKALGGEPEPVARVRDVLAGHAGGAVPVRIYGGDGNAPRTLVVYAHGGGWVTGSLDSHDRLCRILANRLDAVVAAVGYRCAPEHPYPAALDDFDAAWHWCVEEARGLHADLARTVVAGDSSGANLAVALALRLARRREAMPSLQLLLYPALDAATAQPSYDRFATGFNLTAAMMRWYWREYARDHARDDPELSPLAAHDLRGLPPAVIAVAGADVLRDDGLAYADALRRAGVGADVVDCAGMIHGFLRWHGAVPAAYRWTDAIVAAARARLGRSR